MIVWGSSMTTIGSEYRGGSESPAIDFGAATCNPIEIVVEIAPEVAVEGKAGRGRYVGCIAISHGRDRRLGHCNRESHCHGGNDRRRENGWSNHFGDIADLGGGYEMFLPMGRTFNPRTGLASRPRAFRQTFPRRPIKP